MSEYNSDSTSRQQGSQLGQHRASAAPISDRWEREEILRSAAEAQDTTIRRPEFARYADPPADTAYPLEYAYHLLGRSLDKVIVDLGCGSGENIPILANRGARVIGIDISPDLLGVAAERLRRSGTNAELREASVYDTGLGSESVDVIFGIALLHHLDLGKARNEVLRILRPGGVMIVMEPVRDSEAYDRLRRVIPMHSAEVSSFERPLRTSELQEFSAGFDQSEVRRFRLPFIPLLDVVRLGSAPSIWKLDRWLLNASPFLRRYATVEVFRLEKAVARV
jgi:SAM-dependent methyltransferase